MGASPTLKVTEALARTIMASSRIAKNIQTAWSLDPGATAITYLGRRISWGELRTGAEALDHSLSMAGIGAESPVGVLLQNRPGSIAALLALLVSGRCIVSLSPFQPVESLQAELKKFQLPAVIASEQDWKSGMVETMQEIGALALKINDEDLTAVGVLSESRRQPVAEQLRPGTALEILTSGTTGIPKRIQISFATIDDSVVGTPSKESGSGAKPFVLKTTPTIVAAPLMHISGMFGSLLPIAEGRPIVLLPKFEVNSWVEAVAQYRIKFASLPPTPMRMVLDANAPKEKLASLVAVRSGTAALPVETQREFEERYGVPVLVQYGATEWMGGLTGWTLEDHQAHIATKLGSVGRARGDVKLRVVNPETDEVLPTDQIGVLEVMPRQRLGSNEWVRTSDLASLDSDEFLYIHGRADDTIVRGGFKIQLNYVADVLRTHPAVAEAAVIGLPDVRLGQVPVAAIEAKPDVPAPTADELIAFAKKFLTSYQIPIQIRVVSALPRTISMKVSRPGVRELFETP